MNSLRALWEFSLALCAIAAITLACLLVARILTEGRAQRREAERNRIKPILLGAEMDEDFPAPRRRLEQIEAMRMSVELAEFVRGSDRDALLRRAEQLGIRKTLHKQAVSRIAQDRLLAAEALAMFPEEAERVGSMLDDRNPDVRLGAALAMAQNHVAPPARDLVARLGLGTTEHSLLIVSLMRDLVERDDEDVEAMLYDPSLPDAAKLAATDALAESGRVAQAPLVAWMAEAAAGETELLPRIYHALGRIGHPAGHRAIARGLDHADWQVRAAAAQAAGMTRFIGAIERLVQLLADDEWWVRFRAGEALARLGKPGIEALLQVTSDGHGLARQAARLTIAERMSA